MAYTCPTVNYSTTLNGTYTQLTGVQSVSIRRGRTYFQDNFAGSRCVIELVPANSYTTPLAIGQYIDVRVTNSASADAYFVGRITDVERTFDIPYSASATVNAPGDRITITAVGPTGMIASNTIASYSFFLTYTSGQAVEAASFADVYLFASNVPVVNSSLTSVSNTGALDVINQLARTDQSVLDDIDNERTTNPYSPPNLNVIAWYHGVNGALTAAFVDTGVGTKYNRLAFKSAAESTFNDVNVVTPGKTTQNYQAATGPYNTLDYNTYSNTTTEMLNLATYLYTLLSGQTTVAPFELATDTAIDDTFLSFCYITSPTGTLTYLGAPASIKFRGTTYAATIQSINVNFYPDRATGQFTFAPTLGQPFLLDSNEFGILGTNRLGYP
jgi:hypothetical protein